MQLLYTDGRTLECYLRSGSVSMFVVSEPGESSSLFVNQRDPQSECENVEKVAIHSHSPCPTLGYLLL